MTDSLQNWAGNIAYGAARLAEPTSLEALQQVVRDSRKLRPLGSRHSFNWISDTDDTLVSLRRLERVIDIDRQRARVTVDGGITYGELGPVLHAAGFALHNLASLPHISVAGAVSTATHGSGRANRNLAAAVRGLEIVTADGDIVRLERGDDGFDGAVVGLGALGVVTRVTLDLLPAFEVRQNVYLDLPFAHYVDNIDAIMGIAYSVSAFTHWRGDAIAHVWLKSLATDAAAPDRLFGAAQAPRSIHPIQTIDPAPATEQVGVAGAWHERLPHFRMDFTPSAGAELQTEYFVPFARAREALSALRAVQEQFAGLLLVSELRAVAADELWMSMNYRRDSLAIHFTWQQDWASVQAVLPVVEQALAPFELRPHWGKLFTLPDAAVQAQYERLGDFRRLLARHDPTGKFRNPFIDRYVF